MLCGSDTRVPFLIRDMSIWHSIEVVDSARSARWHDSQLIKITADLFAHFVNVIGALRCPERD